MSGAKHTPGPWVQHHGPRDTMVSINTLDGKEIGGVWCETWSTKERGINENVVANARLVAAAPDLLKALKQLLTVDVTHVSALHNAAQDAHAAIAKAEGRS